MLHGVVNDSSANTMNLVLCGLLSTVAIVLCVVFDETLMFNMMMCVFTCLAIVSLWTSETDKKTDQTEIDKNETCDDVTQESTKQD